MLDYGNPGFCENPEDEKKNREREKERERISSTRSSFCFFTPIAWRLAL